MQQKYGISVVPLQINFSDRHYADGVTIQPDEIYDMMESECPTSSLPLSEDVIAAFDKARDQGCTDVLFISISSGLSGCFQFVTLLAAEYSGLSITVYDSKTLSCGQQALAIEAARAAAQGCGIDEIVARLTEIRNRMESYFVVKTLEYLAKGGRIGKVAGTVGSLLHLSPVISVNSDGVYETAFKTIGFGRATELFVQDVIKKFRGKNIVASLVHARNELGARAVLQKLRVYCNIVESAVEPVSPVLGVHTGPGLIGLIVYEACDASGGEPAPTPAQ